MSDIGRKVVGFFSQLVLLPMCAITWILGSPYLMTLLCIMSEVLVELVVSAVMAGVSLVVSAVILMEDDNRPMMGEQRIGLPKILDNVMDSSQKVKSTSTKSLEEVLESKAREKAESEACTDKKPSRDEGDGTPQGSMSSQTKRSSISSAEKVPSKGASGGSLEKSAA